MAYKTTDLDGAVIGAGGSYPLGDLKNKPGGTRVNRKMMSDIWQFFQRMMSKVGITPNSTPDNDANGYQLMEAFTTHINGMVSVLSANASAGPGTTTAVLISGLGFHAGPPVTFDPGWLFYNGMLVYCPGDTFTASAHIQATITNIEGLPTCHFSPTASAPVVDGMHFNWAGTQTWAIAVGTNALFSDVTDLYNRTDIGAWINVFNFGTNWIAGAVTPRFRKDGMGRVYCQGHVQNTVGSTYVVPFTFPPTSGYYPTENMLFNVTVNDGAGNYSAAVVELDIVGNVTLMNPGTLPLGAAGAYIDISNIYFLTT